MAKINFKVQDRVSERPVAGAAIQVAGIKKQYETDENGEVDISLNNGQHNVAVSAFGHDVTTTVSVPGEPVIFELGLNARLEARGENAASASDHFIRGEIVQLSASLTSPKKRVLEYEWRLTRNGKGKDLDVVGERNRPVISWNTEPVEDGTVKLLVKVTDLTNSGESITIDRSILVRGDSRAVLSNALASGRSVASNIQSIAANGVTVDMERARRKGTPQILTWAAIKKTTDALSFNNYKAFMDYVLCNDDEALLRLEPSEQEIITGAKTTENLALRKRRFLPYTDTDAYRLLKVATEAFVIVNCGIPIEDFVDDDLYAQLLNQFDAEDASGQTAAEFWQQYQLTVNGTTGYTLPYLLLIRNKLPDVPIKKRIFSEEPFNPDEAERCYGILMDKLFYPCMIELIWSYWHEEGMQVQTINAISRRFQNMRGPAERDPLANLEIDPLRPLNNLIWGFVQDEPHRLSVLRRAYEYDHHYGLSLEGDAIPAMRTADSRSRFLDAFHQMLQIASVFYKQDDDTTIIADGFALLNALRDLHMILSEGAHGQFGEMPVTARIEMLMEQWLLARPEFRELLPSRTMVAYPEPWMDRVDAMKRVQGWTDTSVANFRFLAIYGEQILLSVRFTNWSEIDDAEMAALWARFFRNQIKGYIHAYRSVTSVDLGAEVTTSQQQELMSTRPSVLLRRRLRSGQPAPALTAGASAPQGFRQRRAARQPSGK